MCGIVGGAAVTPDLSTSEIAPAISKLIHRGPDGEQVWSDGYCVLAQRRLAIIDLTDAGQAPLANEDGTVWVTHNGEIYNFGELRRDLEAQGHRFSSDSDTEVIVHAYEQWGTSCVERFRGMFAFAVWDSRRRELFLARDRVGKKPLFYTSTPTSFFFASEMQGLLAVPRVDRGDVDLAAVDAYLSWGYVPAPASGFTNIRKLEPGSLLTVKVSDRVVVSSRRYWNVAFLPKQPLNLEEAAHSVRKELTEAVRLRLISDVPVGAFLSGGVDSSVVVGLMAQLSPDPVRTFSIGFADHAYNELEHARRIAEMWGCDHTEHVVDPDALEVLPTLVRHYGEPYADSSALPTFYVARETSRAVKVALNGDGGDECFAGYDRYRAHRIARSLSRIPRAPVALPALAKLFPRSGDPRSKIRRIRRFLEAAGAEDHIRYAHWSSYFSASHKREIAGPLLSRQPGSGEEWFGSLFDSTTGLDAAEQAMSVDIRSYLPFDLLVKVDIASMANSLEPRSPFLDHHVMELAASLPSNMKLRGRTSKYVLREACADLLPAENVERPKMGFGVPIAAWLRGPLAGFLREVLLSEQCMSRGYVRTEAVRRLVDEHTAGRADHAAQLWSLVMLEMWHLEVVERSPVST